MRSLTAAALVSAMALLASCGGDPSQPDQRQASFFGQGDGEDCALNMQCDGDLVCRPIAVVYTLDEDRNVVPIPYACQDRADTLDNCGGDFACAICTHKEDCQDGQTCSGATFDQQSWSTQNYIFSPLLYAGICEPEAPMPDADPYAQ